MTTTTAPRQRIATIRGTFARPGVSQNRRLYTRDHIAAAVSEAQAAIDAGDFPSMMTHHGARDPRMGDVARTAGRVTKVALSPEGYGTFEAELADTQAGRDVAALVTPEQPYLKGVSMAAQWRGTPRTVMAPDGSGPAETADGFSLKGIDFTHNPGIAGAEISSVAESSDLRLIFESITDLRKGLPMAATLTDPQVTALGRIFKDCGTGPDVIRRTAASMGIAESEVSQVAVVFESAKAKVTAFLEAAGDKPNTADPSKMSTAELHEAFGDLAPTAFRSFGGSGRGKQITESGPAAPAAADAAATRAATASIDAQRGPRQNGLDQQVTAMVDRVNAVEARGLENASIADLATLAAAYVPR